MNENEPQYEDNPLHSQFTRRQEFLAYAVPALAIGAKLFSDAPGFDKKFGVSQYEAQKQFMKLQKAITDRDFVSRNEAIDFFISAIEAKR